MVVSEIVAATMIAVCGLKRSYRIVLKGERLVRLRIRRPEPIVAGYQSFPRAFIRTVFRAGHTIAMRWEGRAQNAAQRARAARLRAYEARDKVADVSADMRARAEEVRARAEEVRDRARDTAAKAHAQLRAAQEAAKAAQKQVQDARERLVAARDAAASAAGRARDAAVRARDALPASMRPSNRPGESKGLAEVLDDEDGAVSKGKVQSGATEQFLSPSPESSSEKDDANRRTGRPQGLASLLDDESGRKMTTEGEERTGQSVQRRQR